MARFPVILMFVWKNLGFAVIIFLAALQAIPEPLYEYARLEGAMLSLPGVQDHAAAGGSLGLSGAHSRVDNAFKIFKEVYFIGGAYPGPPFTPCKTI